MTVPGRTASRGLGTVRTGEGTNRARPPQKPPTRREPPLCLPARLCAALATGNMMRAQCVSLTPLKNKMVAAEVAEGQGPVGNAGLLLAAAELCGRAGRSQPVPGCSPAPPGHRRARRDEPGAQRSEHSSDDSAK